MLNDKTFLTIINTIPNPIIVTDGKEFIVSNDTFLDFTPSFTIVVITHHS